MMKREIKLCIYLSICGLDFLYNATLQWYNTVGIWKFNLGENNETKRYFKNIKR